MKSRRRPFAWVALALASAAAAYFGGLAWFAQTIPRQPAAEMPTTDAIVVLTGGPMRLREGLRLLAEGKGRKLLVSGVYRGVDVQELLRVARQEPESVECCVELGYAADSTLGNAAETAAWMAREGFASLRLVTANYHMRRSLLEFRRAMPGTDIVPHPVFPDAFRIDAWWRWPGTYALVQAEYHKYVVALLRPYVPLGAADAGAAGGDLP
ncbi:MAG: YdcF family protein [Rhodospirillales bacterium]|nr:YdcF family protein [Rhodospirillales bacterium]